MYLVYVFNRGWITKTQMSSEYSEALLMRRETAIARARPYTDHEGYPGAVIISKADLDEVLSK